MKKFQIKTFIQYSRLGHLVWYEKNFPEPAPGLDSTTLNQKTATYV